MRAFSPSIFSSFAFIFSPFARVSSTSIVPVFFLDEGLYLVFPLADELEGDGLHPSGGEAVLHPLPQEGAYLVAHEPVEDAPRLLRVVLRLVEVFRRLHRLQDGLFRDLVEEDPLYGRALALGYLFGHVKGYGLAFPVGVRPYEDLSASLLAFLISATIFALPLTTVNCGLKP